MKKETTKIKRKEYIEKTFKESQVMVLIEDMRDEIKIIAENQTATNKKVEGLGCEVQNLRQEMQQGFADVRREVADVRQEVADVRQDLEGVRKEMHERFDFTMEAFDNQGHELKEKADKKEVRQLETRVLSLESSQ